MLVLRDYWNHRKEMGIRQNILTQIVTVRIGVKEKTILGDST